MLWQQSTDVLLILLLFLLMVALLLWPLLAVVADLQTGHIAQVCCKAQLKYQDECSGCPAVCRYGG